MKKSFKDIVYPYTKEEMRDLLIWATGLDWKILEFFESNQTVFLDSGMDSLWVSLIDTSIAYVDFSDHPDLFNQIAILLGYKKYYNTLDFVKIL